MLQKNPTYKGVMTDMSKSKLVLGFLVALSTIVFSVAPAFAEFSSKATLGKMTIKEDTVEGGGGTLTCTSGEAQWKLPKSPSPREIVIGKGSKNCLAKSSEFKEIEITTNACEEELISQSKGVTKEAEILATVLTTCTVTMKVLGLTCEIKIEPEGNKELKKAKATNEGSNIALLAEFEKVTTKLGGTCPGIKPTKEAKDKGKGLLENEKLV